MINFCISLSRKKKNRERDGNRRRRWGLEVWKINVLSYDVTVLDRDWSKGRTFKSLLVVEQYNNRALWKPGFSVCKSLCSPLDNKEKKGRDCVWLRAWLTEGSSACLLFIKLHLLDRKGPRPSWETRWSAGSVSFPLTLKMCRRDKATQPKR